MKLPRDRVDIVAASSAIVTCLSATMVIASECFPNNHVVLRPPPWLFITGILIAFAHMFGLPITILYVLTTRRKGPAAMLTYVVLACWLGSMAWLARLLASR